MQSPSVLLTRMSRLLRRHRLPQPEAEYEVLGGRYRVDFAWPEARLAVEVDGYATHSSVHAFQENRARQNDLVAAGWTVLRFTWADVRGRHGWVAALSDALAASRPA